VSSTRRSLVPIPALVAVDTRLRDRWEREQALRAQARRLVPEKWHRDARPEMRLVIDSFAEAMVRRELKLVR
jgi:hypothetical protein